MIEDLSPDDHDEDEVFEDVREVDVALLVVPGEGHLPQVLHLLDVVVIVGDVPAEGLPEGEQELRVRGHRDEASRVGVEEGPNDPEVLREV